MPPRDFLVTHGNSGTPAGLPSSSEDSSSSVGVENRARFLRREAQWRRWVKNDPTADFPAEKGRYHLYIADACPWAHRATMVLKLKGLEETISVTSVLPTWRKTRKNDEADEHCGWVFADPDAEPYPNSAGRGGPFPASLPGCDPDPIFGAYSVREIYEKCGDMGKLYSVPILFDKKRKTIVSNESADIICMLNSEFNDFAENPDLDLYPAKMSESIDKVNEWIYNDLNNGVYKCGFAKSQEAYDEAISKVTAAFDQVVDILSNSRYIAGDRLTLADIRLVATLFRFDEIYSVYFKTNTRSVTGTPILLDYCREIFQMPGLAETLNMEYVKMHYYTSHPTCNHFSIIPRGNDFVSMLKESHNRRTRKLNWCQRMFQSV